MRWLLLLCLLMLNVANAASVSDTIPSKAIQLMPVLYSTQQQFFPNYPYLYYGESHQGVFLPCILSILS